MLCVPAVLTAEALDSLNAWANANADRVAGTILENVGHFGLRWPGARIGGYMLNAAARALKTNRTYSIGVLFIDSTSAGLAHEYFSEILESFKNTAEDAYTG